MKVLLLFPFYIRGNWGREGWSNLPRFTQFITDRQDLKLKISTLQQQSITFNQSYVLKTNWNWRAGERSCEPRLMQGWYLYENKEVRWKNRFGSRWNEVLWFWLNFAPAFQRRIKSSMTIIQLSYRLNAG